MALFRTSRAAGAMATAEKPMSMVANPLADFAVHPAGDMTTAENSTTAVTSPLANVDAREVDATPTAEGSTNVVTTPLADVDACAVDAMATVETTAVTSSLGDVEARIVDDVPTEDSAINIPIMTTPLADVNVHYVEVYDEPFHPTVLNNDYVRVLQAGCPANHETMFHRHSQDGFYIFFESTQVRTAIILL